MLADGGPVYGVNTGMGALSGVALTDGQQRAHQRNLMLARAVGGPPWLPYGDVRALFAVRLRTFLTGDAGVSAALCQRLADVLDAGLVPAVPRGGVGQRRARSSRWRTRSARWWASARCWRAVLAASGTRPAGWPRPVSTRSRWAPRRASR